MQQDQNDQFFHINQIQNVNIRKQKTAKIK